MTIKITEELIDTMKFYQRHLTVFLLDYTKSTDEFLRVKIIHEIQRVTKWINTYDSQ